MNREESEKLVHDPSGGIARLVEIMARLRDRETGCPWDIEQDFKSIAPYTLEEAYEVADAIERDAWDELRLELGDLLFQVVYHAQMASEAGHFDFDGVVQGISQKMVDRHPHVFGDESNLKTAEDQVRDWEAMKAKERGAAASVLDGVAVGLPALTRAVKLQNRAARVGFDWPQVSEVLEKLVEEADELTQAAPEDVEEEYGDLAFVMANLARHMNIDPEQALRRANDKFIRRFSAIERSMAADGRDISKASLAEMDAIWDEVKAAERAAKTSG